MAREATIEQLREELAEAAKHLMAADVLIEKLRVEGRAVHVQVEDLTDRATVAAARALLRVKLPAAPPAAFEETAQQLVARTARLAA